MKALDLFEYVVQLHNLILGAIIPSVIERTVRYLTLQSIYVTLDRVFLKFEARVQIYVAVLNIGCEI